jgi:hypothetical protein
MRPNSEMPWEHNGNAIASLPLWIGSAFFAPEAMSHSAYEHEKSMNQVVRCKNEIYSFWNSSDISVAMHFCMIRRVRQIDAAV